MKKRIFSFSNFWTTLTSFVLLLICTLIYIIFGLQISSANAKRSDLVRYSALYETSFMYSQSELKSFADSSAKEHYNNYYKTITGNGDLVLSRKMIEEIGLEKSEKTILEEFDSVFSKYIEPANKKATDYAVSKSDFKNAKAALSTKEYSEYLTYGNSCLKALSESVYNRMTDTLKKLSVRQNIIMICLICLCVFFSAMLMITYFRLKALARMAESEDDTSDRIQKDMSEQK